MKTSTAKPKSLYRELTLTLAVLISLVSIAVGALDYLYASRTQLAQFESNATRYESDLKQLLELPLWKVDDAMVQKIGNALTTNKEFASLSIRDEHQRVIYEFSKDDVVNIRRDIVIRHNDQVIGSVEIGLSFRSYQEENRRMIMAAIGIAGLLIVVLFGLLRWALNRLLKKPVDTMIGSVNEIVEGEYQQLAAAEVYEEFAPIISSINTMSAAVASREESLRIKSEELELYFSSALDLLCIADTDGYFRKLNPAWEMTLGYPLDELLGRKFLELVHPEDLDGTLQAISTLSAQNPVLNFTNRYQHKDGSYRWIEWRSFPVGKMIYASARDITERRQIEGDLYKSRQLLTAVVENIPAMVFLKRASDLNFELFNKAGEQLLGYDRNDLIGKNDYDFFGKEQADFIVAKDREVLKSKKVLEIPEESISSSDGSKKILQTFKIGLFDAEGQPTHLLGISVDITGRKRAEEELIRYKNHLEEEVETRTADLVLARNAADTANRAKSVFLANMSHELRTPLNAILGFSSLMSKDPLLQPEQHENLDIINRSGEHLLVLINEVLEMSKIEAGRVELENSPFDLGGMVRDVSDMMHVRANDKGLQLLVEQSSKVPRFINGDEARLRQVLINLVGNAVKFTQQGGVTLRFGVKPDVEREHLLIEVEDSGIGIKPEDQQRIFEPFVQLGEDATQKGTGLGLTLARQYVQLMGGKIEVESTPGKGSVFRVELPLEVAEGAEVSRQKGNVPRDVTGLAPDQPEYRIMIAEDQRENQLLLARLMANIGIQARVAENGAQAVELFKSWQPHLIWMDRRMPVMDGIEATRKIRELPGGKEVKIVAVTASAFTEQRDEMFKVGMDDFVRKPYRFNEIYECMGKQLGIKYIYADQGAAEPANEMQLTAEMLAVLPVALRDELRAALESLESERISTAIRQVSAYDSALTKTLSHIAENFDYPAILKALQNQSTGKGI